MDELHRSVYVMCALMGQTPAAAATALELDEATVQMLLAEACTEVRGQGIAAGDSADLAAVRARSERLVPRDPATTAAFEAIVRTIFVPSLKAARFRKTRNVWRRLRGALMQSVDVQRGKSTGDFLTFTSNWTAAIPGLGGARFGRVGGRIGSFLPDRGDHWWSIQLGWLARYLPPPGVEEPDACRREIEHGLSEMVRFLDDLGSVAALIDLVENDGGRVVSYPSTVTAAEALIVELRKWDAEQAAASTLTADRSPDELRPG